MMQILSKLNPIEILKSGYAFVEKDGKIVLSSRAENNKIIHFEGEKELVGTFCNIKVTLKGF